MRNVTDRDIIPIVLEQFPTNFVGYAVELGAADGLYLSNTYGLEKVGWKVLCIEPFQKYYKELVKNRPITLNVACASYNLDPQPLLVYSRTEGQEPVTSLWGLDDDFIEHFCPDAKKESEELVDTKTLDWCLETVGFPRLDFLSLDVDGIEVDVLNGFDIKRWGPTIAAVENPFDSLEIKGYFEDANYHLIARTHVNDIWVKL
jgi:FkbM family methyltransferase